MSTLVLLRHGESDWNRKNLFTGWADVDLTETGVTEATEAGRLLAEEGIAFDIAHTSLQRRALRTLELTLSGLDQLWVPVRKHWRLNERHYGDLQGLNKKDATERWGEEQVYAWRRSYDVPPPPLGLDDERHPRFDARYSSLPPDVLPASECLKDVVARVLPYWHDEVCVDLLAGRTVLVAAHGNSLRALVKHLDGISDEDIAEVNIPTGFPLVYEIDDTDPCRPVKDPRYLGDPETVRAKIEGVKHQATAGPDTGADAPGPADT
jgi:2,3-bisphosphoglycerate-dependent phosphoglycerate mutase